MWTHGVPVEPEAKQQLANTARLPIVFKHVAAMPDVHLGIGATVGSVVPTLKAIIPAAVGVDIGCGMMAAKTTLRAEDLPDNLGRLRSAHRTRGAARQRSHCAAAARDTRQLGRTRPTRVDAAWAPLAAEFDALCEIYPRLQQHEQPQAPGNARQRQPLHRGVPRRGRRGVVHAAHRVRVAWAMPSAPTSSNSRRRTRNSTSATCPTRTWRTSRKAPSTSATTCVAVSWAQDFARRNREVMMAAVIEARCAGVIAKPFEIARGGGELPPQLRADAKRHFGEDVFVTRKGAVSAEARASSASFPAAWARRSFIVRGLGNPESFRAAATGRAAS